MSRIHLLLADVPAILGDIIAMLAEESGLTIVGHIGASANLAEAVRQSGAEVVLMSERMKRTSTGADLQRRHPEVGLLTLSEGGRTLLVYAKGSCVNELHDPSPRELIAAILGR